MVQQVQIRPLWACGRRCQGPAGQMSLCGTVRESLCLLTGQLHGWMSPDDGGEEKHEIGGGNKGSDGGHGRVRKMQRYKRYKVQCKERRVKKSEEVREGAGQET